MGAWYAGPPPSAPSAHRGPSGRERTPDASPFPVGVRRPALRGIRLIEAAARDPEAEILVMHAGRAATAGRGAHAPRVVREAAAAEDAVGVVARRIEQIPAPLPHVAEH